MKREIEITLRTLTWELGSKIHQGTQYRKRSISAREKDSGGGWLMWGTLSLRKYETSWGGCPISSWLSGAGAVKGDKNWIIDKKKRISTERKSSEDWCLKNVDLLQQAKPSLWWRLSQKYQENGKLENDVIEAGRETWSIKGSMSKSCCVNKSCWPWWRLTHCYCWSAILINMGFREYMGP